MNELLMSAGMGVCGALVKEILIDNSLSLPKKINGELSLGCLGGLIIGAFAGWAVDGNPITAFLGGYAGKQIIEQLILSRKEITLEKKSNVVETTTKEPEDIKALIRRVATAEGVDPELAIRVAICESNLDPKARNVNSPNSIDRGLYQINSHYHPYVTDEMADDPEQATKFFCRAVKNGQISMWNASKTCWNIEEK